MSEICLSVAAETVGEMSDIIQAQQSEVKMVELRIDHLIEPREAELEALVKVCKLRGICVLWTVRSKTEQGHFNGSEAERAHWLQKGDDFGADWIDVEWQSELSTSFKPKQAKLVLSHHDFEQVPDDAEERVLEMAKVLATYGEGLVKVAFAAQSTADCVRVMSLYKLLPSGQAIAIAMGEFGEPSRLFGAKCGMPWTYACGDEQDATAPGQFSLTELHDRYDYTSLSSDTPSYAVIGNPIAHSLSPHIHNAHYRKEGIHAVYGKIRVDDMEAFEALADIIGLSGASVTVPHKESLMKYLPEGHPLKDVGAANTLMRKEQSRGVANADMEWDVANTDIEAALSAIQIQLAEANTAPRVLILGAGGVSRALAYGMVQKGWRVTVTNRSQGRCDQLVKEIPQLEWVHWDDRNAHGFDVVVNGTTLGMHPHEDTTPLTFEGGHAGLVVFDTVYTPEITLFLSEAKEAGANIVTGREMFYRQAALQHQHWFGHAAPWESMEAILRHLSAS